MPTLNLAGSRSYTAGTHLVKTFNVPNNFTGGKVAFSQTGWPANTDVAKLALEVSYDNGVTWQSIGGFTLAAVPAGTVDIYLGTITESSLTITLPQPANATTVGRVTVDVLANFTTAISASL